MQPKKENPQNRPPVPKRRFDFGIYILLAVIMIGFFMFFSNLGEDKVTQLTYAEFSHKITVSEIKTVNSRPVGGENQGIYHVFGEMTNGTKYELTMHEQFLLAEVENLPSTIEYRALTKSSTSFWGVILSLTPILLAVLLLFIIFKNMSGSNNKAFDFAKSRARLNREKSVTFKDVAGCDEEKQELEELIDFLKNPKKYVEIGARIPKGVLLVGPPGTGKTLLARAVAGEASVPFFSISGSDFVEMFVGVGASRVRDLFKTAKENSPCIIFIDEIDAVGRQRGAGLGGGHDEREQTLNQLLVEMDGFSANLGIIMIAATNRPDVLDPALLRPGRFDRQVTINLPDVSGREAILKVHARNKRLDPNVRFDEVAHRIPGFSGADIENLLNEAALLSARDNRKVIVSTDIDEAIDRVMMGPAKKSKKITQKEKELIAYHEAGHAVIGIKVDAANIVQKVTIIPRGRAGGYNLMTPEVETFLETKQSLLDRITGFLAGRVAEELVFGVNTTGAHNDFQQATRIARAMVTEFGMSSLGPVQYESENGGVFLGRDYLKEKNFSDQVALEIDKEVRDIIMGCYEHAKRIITENRDLLDQISKYLLEVETLVRADIDEIVKTGKLEWWEKKKIDTQLELDRVREEEKRKETQAQSVGH